MVPCLPRHRDVADVDETRTSRVCPLQHPDGSRCYGELKPASMRTRGVNEKRDHRRDRYGLYRTLETCVINAEHAGAAPAGMPAGPEAGRAVEPPGVVVDAADCYSEHSSSSSSGPQTVGGFVERCGGWDDLMAQVESGMSAPARPSAETAAWAASLLASIPGPWTAPRAEQPARTRSGATDTRRASATQQPAPPASEGGEAPDPRLKKRPVHFVLRCSRCGTMWTRDLVSAINIDHVHVELITKGARPQVYTKGAKYGSDAAAP